MTYITRIIDTGINTAFRRKIELRCISVVSVVIRRAFDLLFLLLRKWSQEARNVVFDGFGIIACQVDWVREPALVKVPGSLDGLCIVGRVGQGDLISSILQFIRRLCSGKSMLYGMRINSLQAMLAERSHF